MRKTGFLYDDRYLLHDTGAYHPEMPDRLKAACNGIEQAGLSQHLIPVKAVKANQKWVEAVHSVKYLMRLEEACLLGMTEFDYPDNQMCKDTYQIALLAVGGILEAARMMIEGTLDNAFCAVRPPGHHAEVSKAMGFCYVNNVAIAARYLQQEWGVGRIGIIDFDVHHGNGTQHIFEADPTVFYYSIHEHPSFSFPGTGRDFEKGVDLGHGFTLNSPMLPGQGDKEFMHYVERDLIPAFEQFKPEFIIVSSGFDAHVDDEMSNINLSTECYTWIMKKIMEMGDQYANGRVLSVLEGGYCIERLPELIANHIRVMLGI